MTGEIETQQHSYASDDYYYELVCSRSLIFRALFEFFLFMGLEDGTQSV